MSAPGVDFSDWLSERALHVERVLARVLPHEDVVPARLHRAMRYSVLGGGKRVRAALVFAAAHACGLTPSAQHDSQAASAQDLAAAAVELVHAYSLVHDDLPCMDDDVLRRGRPTVHVQFDEATALLAGDALQPLAFDLLAQMPIAPQLIVQAMRDLARAAGSLGMAGGQAIDLESVGKALTQQALQQMHVLKTGALLEASVSLGGLAGGANSQQRQALEAYAAAMGLAFQVIDDVLDVTADSSQLGKTPGKDAAANKPTYVTLMGLAQARAFAGELHQRALAALSPLGDSAALLAGLADFIVLRDH
jgi:farnesyl diphosphate synthase